MDISMIRALQEIDALREGLDATIVIDPGEGHEVTQMEYTTGWNIPMKDVTSWEWTREPVTAPDHSRRAIARGKLEESYSSSPWMAIRYKAGVALGARGVHDQAYDMMGGLFMDANPLVNEDPVLRLRAMTDIEGMTSAACVSDKAVGLLDDYRGFIRKTFSKDPSRIVRKKAGEILGYTPIGIWAHEHPILAALGSIAAVGGGIALVNYLGEHFPLPL